MTYSLSRTLALTCALGLLGAACSGDSEGFEPGAPIPTDNTNSTAVERSPTASVETPPGTNDTTTSSTSTTTPTTPTSATDVQDSSTTAAVPDTAQEPELTLTPQATGFDFPPAELETDPNSPNNTRIIRPQDEPIVAAYLAATRAQNLMFSEWPLDADNPVLVSAPFTPALLESFNVGVKNRTDLNHILDISEGLTSRPYVIEDDDGNPDRAIVWDCQIDATFWKDVDTGVKAPPGGGYPNLGAPGVEVGTSTELVRRDGEWLVNAGAEETRACAE